VKANGIRCGSPALRGGETCFFHTPGARERHQAAQLALRPNYGKVMLREMMRVWPARATRDQRALLEYALQIFDNSKP
jgi:hypothetical protein